MGGAARRRVPRGWPEESVCKEDGHHHGRTLRCVPRRWPPCWSMGGGARRRVPRGWPEKSGREEDGHYDGRTLRWPPLRWAPRREMGGGARRRVPRGWPGKSGPEEYEIYDGHTQRWAPPWSNAAVRGGMRHAAMPCEGRINGGKTLPQAVPVRPGSVYCVHYTDGGAASTRVRSARPVPQPPKKKKTGRLMAVRATALSVPRTQEGW